MRIRDAAAVVDGWSFDDEEKWRSVGLGLFYMRGRLCGNRDTIDERLRAREAAAEIADA